MEGGGVVSKKIALEGDRIEEIHRVQTGLMRMGKYLVRPVVIVFGKLCCSNNPQMLEAYKNLFASHIACLLRMAVGELGVFSLCLLHAWIQA